MPETHTLNGFAKICNAAASEWWKNLDGTPKTRNKGEQLMLIVSEIAECMEGERLGSPDKHLPKRRSAEVELVDALIRIFDYAAGHGYDLDGAFWEKLDVNAKRADHNRVNRAKPGGKAW